MWSVEHKERPDEQALMAAAYEAVEVSQTLGARFSDIELIRAIACNSTYLHVLTGSEEKTFVAFASTQERLPHVYEALTRLGYKAIQASERD